MPQEQIWTERIKVQADALREKVEELLREGNVRRIIVKNAEGQTVMELPLTIGIIGAVAAPILAAVGAMAGVAARWSLEVERRDEPGAPKKSSSKKSSSKKASAKKTSTTKSSSKKTSSKKSTTKKST